MLGTRMAQTIKAVSFGVAQAGTAAAVGYALDSLWTKVTTISSNNLIRTLTQFPIGLVVLGEVMRGLAGGMVFDSSVGDAIMVYYFYYSQPGLMASVTALENDVGSKLSQLIAKA